MPTAIGVLCYICLIGIELAINRATRIKEPRFSLVSCRINFRYAKLILVYPRYAIRSKLFSKYIIDKDIDNTAIDIIIYAGEVLYLLPVIILRQKQMLLTSMYVFCSNFLVTKCTRIGFPLNRDQSYLATNDLFYFQITKLINVYSIPATNN